MILALTRAPSLDSLRDLDVQPYYTTARLTELERVLAEDDHWLDQVEELYERTCVSADAGTDVDEAVVSLWGTACDRMAEYQALIEEARGKAHGRFRQLFVAAVQKRMDRLADLMRTMAVVWQELDLTTPDDIYKAVWTIRIPPLAYLRAMGNLFWSAIRHPLSETTIELKTGRLLARE
jgi:hypothetical protein